MRSHVHVNPVAPDLLACVSAVPIPHSLDVEYLVQLALVTRYRVARDGWLTGFRDAMSVPATDFATTKPRGD